MEVEFEFPVLMVKIRSLVDWIDRMGRRFSRFFRFVGDLAAFLSLPGMIIALDFLVRGAVEILKGAPAQISILIPGVRVPGSSFALPFWEGIVAVFLLALFHEGFHGVVAAAQGLRPRYFAFLLFAVIPAAGVEIDEEKLKKRSRRERWRIFAAGSLGNLILAALALAATVPLGYVLDKGVTYEGLEVLNVTNPEIGLRAGDVIVSINGTDARKLDRLIKYLDSLEPGDLVEIETENGTVIGRTAEMDGKARLGVVLSPRIEYRSWWAGPAGFVLRVLLLSFQINIGVALVNLLPVKLLDGGRIAEDILPGARWLSIGTLGLLLFNLIGPYML